MSPLNPSLHFILFIGLAFVLVIIVALVMQQTSAAARARLICPQLRVNQRALVEEMSARCPQGVKFTKDNNGCSVLVCKDPVMAPAPTVRPRFGQPVR